MKAMIDSMYELESVLKSHAERYRLMQPTDAVKLIYQNEFGGGHLIRDEESCLAYLRREYAGVEKDPNAALYEEIGNGMIRVNLAAVREEDVEQLGRSFIRSAAEHTGTLGSFLQKLDVMHKLTVEGIFSFCSKELDNYLTEYTQAGCPMVSHSGLYRTNYAPAYRIVRKQTLTYMIR